MSKIHLQAIQVNKNRKIKWGFKDCLQKSRIDYVKNSKEAG